MSTANRYSVAGSIGANVKWGNCLDREAATAAARQAAADRFVKQVRKEHPNLDDRTVFKMADARRRAWYQRLALKSAAARRARRAAGAA